MVEKEELVKVRRGLVRERRGFRVVLGKLEVSRVLRRRERLLW